ncbi:sigma-70 family RNA polymerase sigma factor [Paenibacillus sp. CF384]|uniref:sigma-70 family RNA polymerase sigma factor n=1 Tax=Paenibacillus sp. CF384 TaxID=1884382 RepID=UPI0015A51EED|nr:sigma-70 family RNA polymerase sigma factor [Paenibacillus sp. CF384]
MAELGGIPIQKDEELVAATVNGDVNAFSLLVERYANALCSVAYGVIGDFHLAQDIVQESLVKAYFNLHTLKDAVKVGSWLYAITYRQSLDAKRKLHNAQQALEGAAGIEHSLTFDEIVEKREIRAEVWKALNGLDERNRIIMVLFHISGFSMASIGKFLNMSVSAVESCHRRTRKLLKQELMDVYFDGLRDQYPALLMKSKVTANIIKKAGHFYIPVSDKTQSSTWFVDQFGLFSDRNGDLILPSGQILYLLPFKPSDIIFAADDVIVPVLSFEVDAITDVYERLKKNGISVGQLENGMTGKHFFFQDLDNNRFGIYQSQ